MISVYLYGAVTETFSGVIRYHQLWYCDSTDSNTLFGCRPSIS